LESANQQKIPYDTHLQKIIYNSKPELELIKKLLEFPEILALSSNNLAAHYIPHYSLELAGLFHLFYHQCRVISKSKEELSTSISRLLLCDVTRIILDKCLNIMGMASPEKM
jgi:arginyl-tRNA synthetase